MKILDIVHKEQINEYGAVARTLGSLFGTKSSQLLTAIKDGLVSAGKWAGPATRAEAEAVAKGLGPEAQRLVAKNPGILDTAVKQANKVRAPSGLRRAGASIASAVSGAKSGVVKTGSIVRNLVSATSGVAIAYAFAEPFIDYYQDMQWALKELEKNPTPEMLESFQAYRNQQITKLAGRVTVLIGTGILAKMPAVIAAKTIGIFSTRAGAWVKEKTQLPNKVLAAMFMTLANSEENAKAIGNWFACSTTAEEGKCPPGLIQRGAAPLLTTLEDMILSMFTTTYDQEAAKIAQAAGASSQPSSSGQGARPADDSKTDIGGTSEPPSSQRPGQSSQNAANAASGAGQTTPRIGDQPDPSKLTPSPRDKWVYYAPGFIQDPVTKKVDFGYVGDRGR